MRPWINQHPHSSALRLESYLIRLHRPFWSQLSWANHMSSPGSYFLIYKTKTPIGICLAGSILYQHICHTAVFGRLKTRETLNFSTTILLTFAGNENKFTPRNTLKADWDDSSSKLVSMRCRRMFYQRICDDKQ